MEKIMVTLPNGFAFKGKWNRNAELRLLNGDDEVFVRELPSGLGQAEQISLLLNRCITSLGTSTKIDINNIRALTVGDRDALLLNLYRITFNNIIHAILTCPNTECREKIDLKLSIGDILASPYQDVKESYELELNENDIDYKIVFRLPTGSDQETIVKMGMNDPDSITIRLLQLCIIEVKKNGYKIKSIDKLPLTVTEAISRRMAELDPQAEILLKMICPVCQKEFTADFDIGDFLFKELLAHSKDIFQEVHLLAWNYHWHEKDILNMTRTRRQIYLNLLADYINSEES